MTRHEPALVMRGLGFPECLRWHADRIWLSDCATKAVLTITPTGSSTVFAEVPHRPMGLGFLDVDAVLVVSMEDRRLLRYDGGVCTESTDLEGVLSQPNDLVVDGRGRAYVSDTGRGELDSTDFAPSRIVLHETGAQPRAVATGLEVSNGLVVTPDERTLIVAETYGHRLTAFTIADDGSLHDRRLFADLPNETPNGIALDAEGAVWVSSHLGGRFLRVLDGGRVVDTIDAPGGSGRTAMACILGGNDGRQLFLASCDQAPAGITTYLPFFAWASTELTGRIDAVTVDVPGAGWP